MSNWTTICALEDIPVLGSRVLLRDDGNNIAIFRTSGDVVFALRDRCPHKAGPLSQGLVYGQTVTCPLHSWNIDLDSGQAHAPDVGCAPRIPCDVRGGWVYLCLTE